MSEPEFPQIRRKQFNGDSGEEAFDKATAWISKEKRQFSIKGISEYECNYSKDGSIKKFVVAVFYDWWGA